MKLEEAIKIIKDIDTLDDIELQEAYETVLHELEHLQKENEELKDIDLTTVYIKGVCDEKDRWRNKIRELILNKKQKIQENSKECESGESMSFVVPGITHCEKHMNPIGLGQVCEDCEKEMENMPPKAREYAKELEKKKMTNREWLLNKMKNMSDEELVETLEKIVNECQYENTNYPCDSDCIPCKAIWLQAEHKEPITLSEAERIILENIDKKYFNYIARNKNGSLYLYFSKPYKNNDAGIWKELSFMHCEDFYMFKNLFQFITWNDSEPYNIEVLLNG